MGPLLKTRLPLIENILKPLAKSVLIPSGLTAAAFAKNSYPQKNIQIGFDYTDDLKSRNKLNYKNS